MEMITKKKVKVETIIDAATVTVGVGGTTTTNSSDFYIGHYDKMLILVTLGTETGTVTFDAKLQVKDSNGNYIDYTNGAITQMTAAGSQYFALTSLQGLVGRIVYTVAGSKGEKYADCTLEVILKS